MALITKLFKLDTNQTANNYSMDNKDMIQYSAAKCYLEKNDYRIKRSNAVLFLTVLGASLLIMMQFLIRFYLH
jgi:hypothetical protein